MVYATALNQFTFESAVQGDIENIGQGQQSKLSEGNVLQSLPNQYALHRMCLGYPEEVDTWLTRFEGRKRT
ncbi:hypothetical protein J6590_102811 [Homalodisca vitripennis]|nr:hypothetical protein J6590_102811 [Homalodisca vitripennis]